MVELKYSVSSTLTDVNTTPVLASHPSCFFSCFRLLDVAKESASVDIGLVPEDDAERRKREQLLRTLHLRRGTGSKRAVTLLVPRA